MIAHAVLFRTCFEGMPELTDQSGPCEQTGGFVLEEHIFETSASIVERVGSVFCFLHGRERCSGRTGIMRTLVIAIP